MVHVRRDVLGPADEARAANLEMLERLTSVVLDRTSTVDLKSYDSFEEDPDCAYRAHI